jgi:hypothetical protein
MTLSKELQYIDSLKAEVEKWKQGESQTNTTIETYRQWLLSHAFGKSNVEVLQEVTLQFEILFPRKEESEKS